MSAIGPVRVARYRHFLGAWDPSAAVRLGRGTLSDDGFVCVEEPWRPIDANAKRVTAIVDDVIGDAREVLTAERPTVAVFTVPQWVARDVWLIESEDGDIENTPGFEDYSLRTIDLFRHIGFALHAPCRARIVATANDATTKLAAHGAHAASAEGATMAVLTNVGEEPIEIVLAAGDDGDAQALLAIRIAPAMGCLVPIAALPYGVLATPDSDFGLHLEVIG